MKIRGREGPSSYEEKANWFSKILFMWLNPLLEKGYKKALNQEDLPQLSLHFVELLTYSTCDRANSIYDKISTDWNNHVTEKLFSLVSVLGIDQAYSRVWHVRLDFPFVWPPS